MIWLAKYGGANPIAQNYNADGAVPLKSGITVAGISGKWNLYSGSNGQNAVYSFLPASGTITNFQGDLLNFFKYLEKNNGFSSEQVIQTIGAGTEPFT